MRKYLWIGSFSSNDIYQQYVSLGYHDAAAHMTQMLLIDGLENILGCVFDSINFLLCPSTLLPCIINKIKWSHRAYANDTVVGYCNIPYFNRIFAYFNMKRQLRDWLSCADQIHGDDVVVFIYGMTSYNLSCAKFLKKSGIKTKIILIIPDLPQFMDLSPSVIKKYLKRFDMCLINTLMKYIDGYILYSEHMSTILKLVDKKWTCITGVVNFKEGRVKLNSVKLDGKKKCKICLYAGTLSIKYGIDVMIEAFLKANLDNVELHIYGSGGMADYVNKMSVLHANIKYYGFQSNEIIKIAEQNASLLLNIRNSNDAYTRYSFPSKLLEYMQSGTPVLSTKLDGIPDEYNKYIYIVDSYDADIISLKMKTILEKSEYELREFGNLAQEFVLRNNNYLAQASKINSFLNSLS